MSAPPERSVFLIGPMGAGKSTVGRLLALRLGWRFVDLDREIERRAGARIPSLFAARGEGAFRRLESGMLSEVATPRKVIACGGGIVERPENRARMLSCGPAIWLDAPFRAAARRVRSQARSARPLWPDDRAAGRLFARRRPGYRACAEIRLAAGDRSAADLTRRAASALSAVRAESYVSRHEGRVTRVRAGPDAWEALPAALRALDATRVAVVTHPVLAHLYGARIDALIRASGHRPVWIEMPEGETSKSARHAFDLWRQFARAGLDRDGVIVLLGGGVVADLGGFAASTYLRGLRTVALPTTTLAQADAAIGGKTAVDLASAKNQIGTFWSPSFLLADTRALGTLPLAEWRDGFAEVVKCALVADAALFVRLERLQHFVREGPVVCGAPLVAAALRIKADFVRRDPRDIGVRRRLNLGHTFAHAYETLSGFRWSHGNAVSAGLVAECRLAERLRLARPETAARVAALLRGLGLPDRPPAARVREVVAAMGTDKKRRGTALGLVLTTRVGGATFRALSPSRLESLLARGTVSGTGG